MAGRVLRTWRRSGSLLGLLLAMAAPVGAQTCGQCSGADLPAYLCPLTGSVESTSGCTGCQQPTIRSTQVDIGGTATAGVGICIVVLTPEVRAVFLYWLAH